MCSYLPWRVAFAILFIALQCCDGLSTATFAQQVLLESAELGTTGRIGGTSITVSQHVGWRFQVNQPLAIEQVGGHLLAFPGEPGDLFAALIRLPALDALPQGAPFLNEEIVATTTFRPNFPSGEVRTPLPVLIGPGSYALVFGTNQFGATGAGAIHNGPDQPDIPPTDISSYIFWGIAFPGQPNVWRTNLASNMRFVIEARPFDITADFDGDGDVDRDDLDDWQAAFGVNATADSDSDGDSDGRDFLEWQRQHGLFNLPVAESTAVPEPSGVVLLIVGCLTWFHLKPTCSVTR